MGALRKFKRVPRKSAWSLAVARRATPAFRGDRCTSIAVPSDIVTVNTSSSTTRTRFASSFPVLKPNVLRNPVS